MKHATTSERLIALKWSKGGRANNPLTHLATCCTTSAGSESSAARDALGIRTNGAAVNSGFLSIAAGGRGSAPGFGAAGPAERQPVVGSRAETRGTGIDIQ